ncbi:ABC transporter ATP-binding protein [Corynebacterium sp. 13CS0277]|uniref:dipeptide ABC transporter ATP-binding protein n=1 Tax=Corynebacterium sp. 13CS0277 TaxID=2071994 RepID=UPI000D0412EE|nr:ABC transporter ATP-binding protein [Corynebacterium sp. 13CS0277]PRQ11858.1 ABC transporter ATP-binding protein [Corynebacterium sp. 13CS0277]
MIQVSNVAIGDIVADVEFTIGRGERVGLIGESGSGKSLTALSIIGLVPPNLAVSGSVTLDGEELIGAPERQLCRIRGKRIAMVFQEPMTALDPLMRAGAQVAEVLSTHHYDGDVDERVRQLFADVALDERHIRAFPHELSGGQRQRVLIAMALANSPDVLICDEPTTALDVTVQRDIVDLIIDLVEERNLGLLFITHDLGLVSHVAEKIVVMQAGRIVEQGPTEQILTRPKEAYTKGLLAASDLTARDAEGHLYTVRSAQDGSYAPGQKLGSPQFPPRGEEILLEASGVSKRYTSGWFRRSHVDALEPLDLTVTRGARLGVVGGSGSGKTTLLKILAGLLAPTTGTVARHGDLQVVFQDPFDSLDPRMTIADSVGEPLGGRPRAERTARVAEVLDEVGIGSDAMARYPHEFSGGQRQRISLARALTVRPKVLLADEPVSALDVSVRAQVMNLLTDLCEAYQLSLVFVSHDLGVVRELCEDVIVMDSGRVVERGAVADVFGAPATDYTRTLLAAIPRIGA